MTFNDLKNFTCGEIGLFTLGQLQLDKLELLKLVAAGEIQLPEHTWDKLYKLCQQAINDYNKICSNKPIELPKPISEPKDSNITLSTIISIIDIIIALVGLYLSQFSTPQTEVNLTINNYITIEEKEVIEDDINKILDELPSMAQEDI